VRYSRSICPKVSIVVPARNEARNLERILPGLPKVHEVILVDGNSTDSTIDSAKRVMPDIVVVQQTRRGKGNALACGFERATGDIIVMFDADGSADPAEIEEFIATLREGADFAKGSRFRPGGASLDITPIRRAGNRALNMLANRMFGTDYSDLCYGYNAFWVDILPTLDLPSSSLGAPADGRLLWGDGFEIETLLNCRVAVAGLTTVEVPSVERLRIFGESNLNAVTDGARVLRTLVLERWRLARSGRGRAATPARPPRTLTSPIQQGRRAGCGRRTTRRSPSA
jgi:glycosyltransferase involved in cell wall biosynthesis